MDFVQTAVIVGGMILFGTLLSCSHSDSRDKQRELASLSRQTGYCEAIQENRLAPPEQCKDAAVKSRDERLKHEFGVR